MNYLTDCTIPDFILRAAGSREMLRLKKVGMDCGCEYTAFPLFAGKAPYSRWDHSLAVSIIVWNFTFDRAEALSGLFHDIATPCFSHVIDFFNNDHLSQESTEKGTREIIASSREISALLEELGITVDEVCDYHMYPIADNDSPRLSSDRLEYTMTNAMRYLGVSADEINRHYRDLTVSINEEGMQELCFTDPLLARDFAFWGLETGRIYSADADRYVMETLALILRKAVNRGIISPDDFYGTEDVLIEKLISDEETGKMWDDFRKLSVVETNCSERPSQEWIKVFTKKRYIDPYVKGMGRVSSLFADFSSLTGQFVNESQDYWLWGH